MRVSLQVGAVATLGLAVSCAAQVRNVPVNSVWRLQPANAPNDPLFVEMIHVQVHNPYKTGAAAAQDVVALIQAGLLAGRLQPDNICIILQGYGHELATQVDNRIYRDSDILFRK